MCVIIHLKPNQSIPWAKLQNAVFNNWHSYGLVVRKGDKFEVIRKVPKEEVYADEVWEHLEGNKAYERFLHLRHNTAGATNEENCHPFEVYKGKGKDPKLVLFMHNGTLYEYKSKILDDKGQKTTIDNDSGPSDSKNFVDEVLSPLTQCDMGSGIADTSNRLYKKTIEKHWGVSPANKGLILSSTDKNPFKLGTWFEIDDMNGGKFSASNNDYFTTVVRGPEQERRDHAAKKRAEEINKSSYSNSRAVVPLSGLNLNQPFQSKFRIKEDLTDIFEDIDLYSREGYALLGALTQGEIERLAADESSAATMLFLVFNELSTLSKELANKDNELSEIEDLLSKETEKHVRATKRIAELTAEINRFRDNKPERVIENYHVHNEVIHS